MIFMASQRGVRFRFGKKSSQIHGGHDMGYSPYVATVARSRNMR
jgi:hypothetical protein